MSHSCCFTMGEEVAPIDFENETFCGCCKRRKVYAVLWTFEGREGNEITLKHGEKVYVIIDQYWKNKSWTWAFVQKKSGGQTGIIPRSFLAPLTYCNNSTTFDGNWYVGEKSESEINETAARLERLEENGTFAVCMDVDNPPLDGKFQSFLLLAKNDGIVGHFPVVRDSVGKYSTADRKNWCSNLFVLIQYLKSNPNKLGIGVELKIGGPTRRVHSRSWTNHTVPSPPIFDKESPSTKRRKEKRSPSKPSKDNASQLEDEKESSIVL